MKLYYTFLFLVFLGMSYWMYDAHRGIPHHTMINQHVGWSNLVNHECYVMSELRAVTWLGSYVTTIDSEHSSGILIDKVPLEKVRQYNILVQELRALKYGHGTTNLPGVIRTGKRLCHF